MDDLGDGEPEPVQVVQASSALFGTLGIKPLLGRPYTAEEEREKSPVVVSANHCGAANMVLIRGYWPDNSTGGLAGHGSRDRLSARPNRVGEKFGCR